MPYVVWPDPTGEPIPGALLYFFLGDSSTGAPTYSDPALMTPNTTGVGAAAPGAFPAIFIDPSLIYKVQLYYPPAGGGSPPFPPSGLVEIWSAYPVGSTDGSNLSSYTATGTNAIELTPFDGTPTITAYEDYQQFLFLAPATSTGDVTVQVGSLAILPLFVNQMQAAAGQILAGQLVVCVYVSDVNETGDPAMVLINAAGASTVITGTDTGVTNAYVMAPNPILEQYAETQLILLTPLNTNTGASTLAMSGLAATPITNAAGNPLAPGALQEGSQYLLTYNGTDFILINPTGAGSTGVAQLKCVSAGGTKTETVTADSVTVFDAAGNGQPTGAINLTGNISSVGANGLDTGAPANNTFYYRFVIYGSAGTALLYSLSRTAPTMPAGYVFSKWVGSVLTDGSANLVAIVQYGRETQYINTSGGLVVVQQGSTGSVSVPTYTAIGIRAPTGAHAPATASKFKFAPFCDAGIMIAAPNANYGSSTATTNMPPVNITGASSSQQSFVAEFVLESDNIYVALRDSNDAITRLGYTDTF